MIWVILLLIFISLLTLGAVMFVYFFLPKFNFNLFRTSSFEKQFEHEASVQIPFFDTYQPTGRKAFVRCSSSKDVKILYKTFAGEKNCTLFKEYYSNKSVCKMACIGFGDCVSVCPQNAITLVNNTAVVTAACNGCGKCVDVCPNGIIELLPKNSPVAIPCAGSTPQCSVSCNGCKRCVEVSKESIFLLDGCARVNPTKITKVEKPEYIIKACPRNIVESFQQKPMKHFKIWKFWYNAILWWEKNRRTM